MTGWGSALPGPVSALPYLNRRLVSTAEQDAVDQIIEIRPSLCIHAGDLFHTVRPYNKIMAIAARELTRLARDNNIPTVIIAGNHDAHRQAQVGAAIEVYRQIENLHVCASSAMERFEIGDCCVTAVPHCLTVSKLQEELAKKMVGRYKVDGFKMDLHWLGSSSSCSIAWARWI